MPSRAVRPQSEPRVPLTALSDEELFAGILQGNERHFNALYERYFSRIYNFIFTRVRNHADAEELTQETFTAVFRSAEGYSGRSTPLAWIYGIAKNTVYSQLRRAKAQDDRMNNGGGESLQPAGNAWTDTPEDQLALRRYLTTIGDCLESVTPWQAEVFVLRHVENLPIQEIAERMDRSNDAIRSSLYRVKRLLVEAGGIDAAPTSA